MSTDLSGIYETERGFLVEIGKSEHQFEAVFPRFGGKRTLKLDDKQVQDVTAGLDGMVLDSGDIQFDSGCWWKKKAGPVFRYKYADCWSGCVSDLNPIRWSACMLPTGMHASVTTSAAHQDGTNFLRPLLVETYESVLSNSPADTKTITDYDGLREFLGLHEFNAFKWRREGSSAWSDWMSKVEVSRDVKLQNPNLGKSHIQITVFAGIPSQWNVEKVKHINSEEAFKAALDITPALKLRRTNTESASAAVVAARLAEEIYEDNPTPSWACKAESSEAFFGVTKATCCEGSCIFVVFRGTIDMMTAITDLKCNLSTDKPWSNKIGIHVHAGMWGDLREAMRGKSSIWSKLVELWKPNKSHVKKLVLTGHSLGGGLAMMLHAYIWILLKCEAKDSLDSCKEVEEPEFQNFLQSARCYAFAGPMVFAKCGALGEGSLQKEFDAHMVKTAKNFMFREDLVPRAFSALDVEKALKEIAKQALKTQRKQNMVARMLENLISKAVAKLASKADLSAYNKYACKYSHCCMVEVIGQRSLPWYKIKYGMESVTHHSIRTYRTSIECREQSEGFFENFSVSFETPESGSRPLSFHAVDPSELWKMAEDGEADLSKWNEVLMALEAKSESPDMFLHLAAFQHNRHAIIGLFRLGADPLSCYGGKSIDETSKTNAKATRPEEFCSWLRMIVDVAENLHSAGTPLEKVAKEIAKEWEESRGLPALAVGDEFRRLKVDNLKAQGLTTAQIELAQIESDENMNETFAEAKERIQKQLNLNEGQLDKQKLDMEDQEEVHEFLDAAKCFDYGQMHDMLQKDPRLSSRTVCGRWSAVMQVVYNSILRGEYNTDDVTKLLGNYPSLETIKGVQADLKKCVEKARIDVEEKEAKQADGEGRRFKGLSALDADQINDYEKEVEMLIKEIIENAGKHPESNMQSLVNAAKESICKK